MVKANNEQSESPKLGLSDPHVYDDEQAERLVAIYTATATVERRRWILDHLDLDAGESALSIGCGPGHEPAAMAELVGEEGRVLGIDNSEDVVAMAEDHCATFPQVTIEPGDATDLPAAEDSFDAAIASLVYEYSPDVDTALAELYRVLRPRGRAAVLAADWDTTVWHSSDADRMEQAIEAWKSVYAHPRLGSQLTAYLDDVGFAVEIDEAGQTFFSLTYYLYMVQKPD